MLSQGPFSVRCSLYSKASVAKEEGVVSSKGIHDREGRSETDGEVPSFVRNVDLDEESASGGDEVLTVCPLLPFVSDFAWSLSGVPTHAPVIALYAGIYMCVAQVIEIQPEDNPDLFDELEFLDPGDIPLSMYVPKVFCMELVVVLE